MEDVISIVVPVYNASKYLKECIDSLLNQTYKNLEIILINDGSTDNSLNICKSYNDSRIKVIDKQNSGVSKTRNLGIETSSGKYLMFVDSDDYLDLDYVEKMYNYLKENNYTTVISGLTQVTDNKKIIGYVKHSSNNCSLTFNNIVPEIVNKITLCSSCKTLFSLEELKNNKLKFKENMKFCEDMLFSFDNLSKTKSIGYLNNNGYYYRKNDESITNNTGLDTFKIYLENNLYALEYIKKITNCSDELIANRVLSKLNTAFKKITYLKYEDFKKYVKMYISNKYISKVNLKTIDYESKANSLLLKLLKNKHYYIYYKVVKLYKNRKV